MTLTGPILEVDLKFRYGIVRRPMNKNDSYRAILEVDLKFRLGIVKRPNNQLTKLERFKVKWHQFVENLHLAKSH